MKRSSRKHRKSRRPRFFDRLISAIAHGVYRAHLEGVALRAYEENLEAYRYEKRPPPKEFTEGYA